MYTKYPYDIVFFTKITRHEKSGDNGEEFSQKILKIVENFVANILLFWMQKFR